jgi:predicted secreted protein with PEFG-CTERM motif
MNTRTSYVAIAIIAAVMTTSTSAAFAQGFFDEEACPDCEGMGSADKAMMGIQADIPITITTNAASYDHETNIIVQGTVSTLKAGTEIGLVVVGPPPFNNIVAIDQIKVSGDGTWKTTLSTAGESWKYDGTYTIKVTYGNQNINNRALVELTGGIGSIGTECNPGELSASRVCIPYTITSGGVSGAVFSGTSNSLTVQISSLGMDGTLTINPPTDAIRGIFMVLVDGEEWDDVIINGNKVVVDYPAGTTEIEIIGTFAIPEFGTIAALILAVAIISIIVVSSRTRLNVLPKY